MASFSDSDFQVREMQGLYGPFCLSERLIQKIWLRQDFASSEMKTASGKKLIVKDPGRWNLLNGPDFKEVRLIVDGRPLSGDVEIHFSIGDWHAHRHAANPDFDRVVLHVVLYEGRENALPAVTKSGHEIETLYLLPLLDRDLEDYAMDEALLALEQIDDLAWVADFLEKSQAERLREIEAEALKRCQQKIRFATKRLKRFGWSEACHQHCLEVLGYARNRIPMSRIALSYPLARCLEKTVSAKTLYESERGFWCLSGVRPVNHPKRRLGQYLEMLSVHPQWPDRIASVLSGWPRPDTSLSTTAFRRIFAVSALCHAFRQDCFGGIGESRFNTLMVDAILPLATAAGILDGRSYWNHWPPGDAPVVLRRFLKHAEITSRGQPLTNGLLQGALGLSLAFHR